ARAHPFAAVRTRLRARRGGTRARELRSLRNAHDGQRSARGSRRRRGTPRGADRRDRRGGGPDGTLWIAPALPADARPPQAANALRGRGPAGSGPAARRAVPAGAPLRLEPPAEHVGEDGSAWGRALLLAHRRCAAPDSSGGARAVHRSEPERRRPRARSRGTTRSVKEPGRLPPCRPSNASFPALPPSLHRRACPTDVGPSVWKRSYAGPGQSSTRPARTSGSLARLPGIRTGHGTGAATCRPPRSHPADTSYLATCASSPPRARTNRWSSPPIRTSPRRPPSAIPSGSSMYATR